MQGKTENRLRTACSSSKWLVELRFISDADHPARRLEVQGNDGPPANGIIIIGMTR